MGAWANVSDVSAYLQRTIDGTSRPSSTDVAVFIADAEAQVHAILRASGFSSSASSPAIDGDLFLRQLATSGAAYFTARAVYVGEGRSTDDGLVKRLQDDWANGLKTLRANPSEATGTTAQDVEGIIAEPAAGSDPDIFPAEPDFRRTMRF